jgi:glutathione peroxidase
MFDLLAQEAGAYPKWNFYKYLIDRDGQIVDYYSSITSPESDKLVSAIERLL